MTGTVAIANGGTGAATQQAAINALAGAVTDKSFLRGNGTNVTLSAIQVADVPTLNQNTTGTAANVTGTVAIANGGTGSTTQNFVDLTTTQTITGAKTFDNSMLALKGTSTGKTTLSTANASATDYTVTLPAATGTVALTSGATTDFTGSLAGDITGTQGATSIASGVIVNADVNASAAIADTKLATIETAGKVSNTATTATNANTASANVARDASGNFSAGTITANVTGNLTRNVTGNTSGTAANVTGTVAIANGGTNSNNAIAQGVTKYGESTSTSSNFVNKNGQTGNAGVLTKYGKIQALATLTTTSATSIVSTSASSGGNITSDGGASVTARGVCWKTSSGPTISDSKTTDGTGTGTFTSTLTGLSASTTYYARAYATNGTGTAYGGEVSFTTLATMTFANGGTRAYIDLEDGASITVNNIVYCFAGYQNHTAGSPDLWTYDLATDTWTQKASLPAADGRTEVPIAYNSTDGKLYTFGANIDSRDYNNLNRYNISTNTWVQLTEMPEARASCGTPLLYYNGGLWILSGGQTTCLRYDIAGNSWSTYTSNVTSRSNHWAGVSTTGKAMVWGPDNLQTQICNLP